MALVRDTKILTTDFHKYERQLLSKDKDWECNRGFKSKRIQLKIAEFKKSSKSKWFYHLIDWNSLMQPVCFSHGRKLTTWRFVWRRMPLNFSNEKEIYYQWEANVRCTGIYRDELTTVYIMINNSSQTWQSFTRLSLSIIGLKIEDTH